MLKRGVFRTLKQILYVFCMKNLFSKVLIPLATQGTSRLCRVSLILLASALMTQEPAALSAATPAPKTFFIEFISHYASFGKSDLDGLLVLGNAEQVFYIPKIESNFGFGLSLGSKSKSGLWAISYLQSVHEATFQGLNSTAVSRMVEINGRTFLLKKAALGPYIILGLNFPWLTVKNNSGKDKTVYDSTYLGVGVNAGAGLLLPLQPRLFICASVIYRYIGYLYAKGPGRGIDVTDLFDDRTGSRHRRYLRAPVLALELSLGYTL
jgi:hypothetical protein